MSDALTLELILRTARALITKPDHWRKGDSMFAPDAANAAGRACTVTSPRAVRFTLNGAVARAARGTTPKAMANYWDSRTWEQLRAQYPATGMPQDHAGQLAILDGAIAALGIVQPADPDAGGTGR